MEKRDHSCFFSAAHAAKDSGIALKLSKEQGLNRFTWDLSYPGPRDGSGRVGGGGPTAVPGRYQVRLTANGVSQTQPLVVALR